MPSAVAPQDVTSFNAPFYNAGEKEKIGPTVSVVDCPPLGASESRHPPNDSGTNGLASPSVIALLRVTRIAIGLADYCR
jgi:hypothetical protein